MASAEGVGVNAAILPIGKRSTRFLLRSVGIYLAYAAILVRAILLFFNEPDLPRMLALLVVFGLLLFASYWLEGEPARLRTGLQVAYLVAQTALILSFSPLNFKQDFFIFLFAPLSLQAVLFFGPRLGFAWIGGFSLLAAGSVILTWQWQLPGFAQGVMMAGLFVFTGSFANRILQAEAMHRQNQRLTGELQVTYQQLQAYAGQAEAYAALQERNRMSRELHDSATQTIFSMNLAVQAAQLVMDKNPEKLVEQLDRIQELAHSAVGEIQSLSSQLRSPLPEAVPAESPNGGAEAWDEDPALPARLRRLAAERQARDGIEVRLEIRGDRRLDRAVSAGLYRIAQEALNNIAKHAGTREAAITLHLEGQPACLEIVDRGAGFDLAAMGRQSGHIGLQSMAERAREIGWLLSLDSSPGRGTSIRIEEVV